MITPWTRGIIQLCLVTVMKFLIDCLISSLTNPASIHRQFNARQYFQHGKLFLEVRLLSVRRAADQQEICLGLHIIIDDHHHTQ